MVEASLRQKVFSFIDENPEAKNKDVYNEFSGESENSLRTYRRDYFKEREKKISQVQVSKKSDISQVGENAIFEPKEPKIDPSHFLSLLKSFNSLPLFIYSKISRNNIKKTLILKNFFKNFLNATISRYIVSYKKFKR